LCEQKKREHNNTFAFHSLTQNPHSCGYEKPEEKNQVHEQVTLKREKMRRKKSPAVGIVRQLLLKL